MEKIKKISKKQVTIYFLRSFFTNIKLTSILFFSLFPALLFFLLLSKPYIFSKISSFSSLGFYSLVEEDYGHKMKTAEILAQDKIIGNFTASEKNLGIVLVRFYNFDRINSDTVIFRLKELGKKTNIYEKEYKVDQFQPNEYFTFGFPTISNSSGKKYLFEIESTEGKHNDAIAISSKVSQTAFAYQFSRNDFSNDYRFILRFGYKKIIYALRHVNLISIFLSILVYFSILAIIIMWKMRGTLFYPVVRQLLYMILYFVIFSLSSFIILTIILVKFFLKILSFLKPIINKFVYNLSSINEYNKY